MASRARFGTLILICMWLVACGNGGQFTRETLQSASSSSTSNSPPVNGIPQQVKALFQSRCVSCHGDFLDMNALLSLGYVVPGNPGASKINIRLQAGTMPPTGPLDAASKQLVFDWINSGAASFKPGATSLYDAGTDQFYILR